MHCMCLINQRGFVLSRYAPLGLKWYMIYAFYQYYAPLGLKFHTPQLALVCN